MGGCWVDGRGGQEIGQGGHSRNLLESWTCAVLAGGGVTQVYPFFKSH